MRSTPDPSIDALLEGVRRQFADSLPDKAANIGALLARGAWDEARRAAHRLRGSAGTYGFTAIGATAGAIEELLLGRQGEPDTADRTRLEQLARDLTDCAAGAS
jgi:HPt (histidine-containing phosphotransfer) domain-containing protein